MPPFPPPCPPRLSRWALRCHACFHVTKEQGATKMFCPRCGNMTMERVEVSVGPDGTEFFGVRRKHCLKGTRFSLPKPKVGRSELHLASLISYHS